MDVKTLFLVFHLILRGKLDICERDDLFFLVFCGKLEGLRKI